MNRALRTPRWMLVVESLSLLWLAAGGLPGLGSVAGAAEPAPYNSLIWEQPPIEWDPLAETAQFCGWDEPAYDEEIPNATSGSSSEPADDFRLTGPMPVTSIHWWGSYQKWQQDAPPAIGPNVWRITFSSNKPADSYDAFSRPGTRLWTFDVLPEQVSVERVGIDRYPDMPEDTCFKYSVELEPPYYFWPNPYEGDIFWISITAVYKTRLPDHRWGWKTRPWVTLGGACEDVSGWSTPAPGSPISFMNHFQIAKKNACGASSACDMTFALDTDPIWIKWDQPFTGLRDWASYQDEPSGARGLAASSIAYKWRQEPDTSSGGVGMDATADIPRTWPAQILGDDYECTQPGPVTQIDLWGCYHLDDLPAGDPNNVQFTLSIREDVPAAGRTGYSMPGKVLWRKIFKKGQFTTQRSTNPRQSFFSPSNAEYITSSHGKTFKYTFTIDRSEAFIQTGTSAKPVTYWLCAQASVTQSAGSAVRFGWKTSTSVWNDDAVWAQATEPFSGTWHKLTYPVFHKRAGEHTALAFAILTSDQSTTELVDRLVIDDWQCENASPVVAAAWWGSYTGYTDLPCRCSVRVAPLKPDYFLLSIWSSPKVAIHITSDVNLPGRKIWEYRAYQYDEVQVGSDKDSQESVKPTGYEPVLRYSVKIPTDQQFTPDALGGTYWFSVVAVYQYPRVANYPWGWTNHERVFGGEAMAVPQITWSEDNTTLHWEPLADQTGAGEDMSFTLFQQAYTLGDPPREP